MRYEFEMECLYCKNSIAPEKIRVSYEVEEGSYKPVDVQLEFANEEHIMSSCILLEDNITKAYELACLDLNERLQNQAESHPSFEG